MRPILDGCLARATLRPKQRALATAVARGAAVGDLELARVAHEAPGPLLGLGAGQDAGGTVLDLDSFRQTWNEHAGPHED